MFALTARTLSEVRLIFFPEVYKMINPGFTETHTGYRLKRITITLIASFCVHTFLPEDVVTFCVKCC